MVKLKFRRRVRWCPLLHCYVKICTHFKLIGFFCICIYRLYPMRKKRMIIGWVSDMKCIVDHLNFYIYLNNFMPCMTVVNGLVTISYFEYFNCYSQRNLVSGLPGMFQKACICASVWLRIQKLFIKLIYSY